MPKNKNSVFLDVDRSLLENRLLIGEPLDEELETIFPLQRDGDASIPSKVILPSAGMCVKTRTTDGDKIFINICHTEEIAKPEDVSEEALMEMCSSDGVPSFRLPVSLGEPRDVPDKSGILAKTFDVAIHTDFFNRVKRNKVFLSFLMTVVIEGLKEKYDLEINTYEKHTILKNRTVMGTLHKHRIQQRPVKKGPLIEEMDVSQRPEASPKESDLPRPTEKSVVSDFGTCNTNADRVPEYHIRKEPPDGNVERLIAEFKMPDVFSSKELTLELGEDRIVLESRKRRYLLDIFIPYFIDQNKSTAQFNLKERVLKLTMPTIPT